MKFPSNPNLKKYLSWVAPFFIFVISIYAAGKWAEQREIHLKTASLLQSAEINVLVLRGLVSRNDYLPYAAGRYPPIKALLAKPSDKGLIEDVNKDLAALQEKSGASVLYLLDTKGLTLASSNWSSSGSFVGQSYLKRPYFEDALGGKRGIFYGVGLTTGTPGLFIADPVIVAGRVVGVLVVKVSVDSIEKTWSKISDPTFLQDKRGIIFLSSVPEWLYKAEAPLSVEDLNWLELHSQYGEDRRYKNLDWKIKAVNQDGVFKLNTALGENRKEFLALTTNIPELGWKLTVTSNYSEIIKARTEAQAIVALIGFLVGMGVLYLRLREKRKKEQERAIAERSQREKERQLQRTARLASVGEMASTIAHELNQPLMALSNFAVATKSMHRTSSPEMLDLALEEIVEQSKRASEIVRRVRAFINPQRASYEYLNINQVITHAVEMLQAELQRTPCPINLSLIPGLAQVRGDKVLLEQVIVNLIQNAIHAQLNMVETDRRIDIATCFKDNMLELEISDNGSGISIEKIDEIFAPFFTTKPEGLGLGLNICRTIIEAHGGNISVRNKPNGGAIFTITLPLVL